ncbi:Uncharacterized protein OBRU01_08400 [Operophtera brumata]|uniref:Uncharacterized protein n=1 Tax=Operophtera brumata TaxID=104452 RepID=A0A0L7LH53_OPEBR|nr:Uncharacterized protein OBRU01_08400 [Operophtera brumata]
MALRHIHLDDDDDDRDAEGAFKKLKPEPGGTSGGTSGTSALSPALGPQHAGHTPTTASCPTPARRRHRTTFTQLWGLSTRDTHPPPPRGSPLRGGGIGPRSHRYLSPDLGLSTRDTRPPPPRAPPPRGGGIGPRSHRYISPALAPQHAGNTPSTASCPTPAKRRHRTTFTQLWARSTRDTRPLPPRVPPLRGGGIGPRSHRYLSPVLGPQHAGHTPPTALCPTPARRRHRTTFTQDHVDTGIYHQLWGLSTRDTRLQAPRAPSLRGGGIGPRSHRYLSPALGPQHTGHTPPTASCPAPVRRRHRTTFTQLWARSTRGTRPPPPRALPLRGGSIGPRSHRYLSPALGPQHAGHTPPTDSEELARTTKLNEARIQLQKALAPAVLPGCNGMMRNIQGYRGYQPYPHPNTINRYPQHHGSYEELQKDIFSLSQMGGGSYPMPQGFSMGHGANMSAVGMRQDTMGKYMFSLSQMGGGSYPMPQGFSMGHGANMSAVGMRQDTLGKYMFSLSQMGGGSYPIPQGFSMGHGANMSAVGMRQDTMGKYMFSLSQMGGGSYPMPQGFSMGHGANMSAVGMRQDTMGMTAEDEWYNKSLSALRMNSGHHANLAAAPMLQYQT